MRKAANPFKRGHAESGSSDAILSSPKRPRTKSRVEDLLQTSDRKPKIKEWKIYFESKDEAIDAHKKVASALKYCTVTIFNRELRNLAQFWLTYVPGSRGNSIPYPLGEDKEKANQCIKKFEDTLGDTLYRQIITYNTCANSDINGIRFTGVLYKSLNKIRDEFGLTIKQLFEETATASTFTGPSRDSAAAPSSLDTKEDDALEELFPELNGPRHSDHYDEPGFPYAKPKE